MKYTVVGDPHVTHKNLNHIEKLFDVVESYGLPVIWLGDQLDTKEVIRGKCVSTWINYFKRSKLKHIVLVGNHDYFNLECQDHSLQFMKQFSNVVVIDEPHTIGNVNFIPYIHNQIDLLAAIKPFKVGSYLFGHLELKDFDFGNGHICANGTDLESFSKFDKVISGHFHKFQAKKNLIYLGTPMSHSFGESDQTKYIGIFDSETGNLDLKIVDFLPQHKTFTINCEAPKATDFEGIDSNNFNRVILTGSEEAITSYCIGSMREEFSQTVKVIKKPTIANLNTSIQITEDASNVTQFNIWATKVGNLNPETIELGLKLLKDAE